MKRQSKSIYKMVAAMMLVAIIVSSCVNAGDVTPASTTTTTTTTVFEHAIMKPWFDTYCASCHATGKSNARDWLYNPANYESSIKGVITNLRSQVVTLRAMPQGISLSAAELNKFKTWYDAGFPAK